MKFTFDCPHCKRSFEVDHTQLASGSFNCCLCGSAPAPDIMRAYQSVGKTMVDLYGCCECNQSTHWLPKEIKK